MRPAIRVDVATVERAACGRPECRAEWGRSGLRTIAFLADGRVVCFCHRRIYDDGIGWRAELSRWFGAAAA